MLLQPAHWALAQRAGEVLARLPGPLSRQASAETHQAVIELATSPHPTVGEAVAEAAALRAALARSLRDQWAARGRRGHPSAGGVD